MKKNRFIPLLFVCAVVAVFTLSCQTKQNQDVPLAKVASKVLFKSGEASYYSFRSPVLVASDNFLMCLCEGRKNGLADNGEIDIVAKFSTNGGKSWSKLSRLFSAEESYTNPTGVIIPQGENGVRILVLFSSSPKNLSKQEIVEKGDAGLVSLFCSYSDDMGKSWSEVKNITSMVASEDVVYVAPSQSGGLFIKGDDGAQALFAGIKISSSSEKSENFLFDTKDGGVSFHVGSKLEGDIDGVALAKFGESELTLLGRPSVKSQSQNMFFAKTFISSDQITLNGQPQLVAPKCNGAIATVNEVDIFALFPFGRERKNLTLLKSCDGGENFTPVLLVFERHSGFSSIASVGQTLLMAFESGRKFPYQEIRFATYNLETKN